MRLVLDAVGDHELFAGLFAGVDHLLAFGGRSGHRLFAKDVLARLGPAHGVLGVHPVGQDDVNDIHVLVVAQVVVGFVIVDARFGETILPGDFAAFVHVAADEGGETRFLAGDDGRKNLVQCEVSQADHGVAHPLAGRQRVGQGAGRLLGLHLKIRQLDRLLLLRFGGTDGSGQDFCGQGGGDHAASGVNEKSAAGERAGGSGRFVGHRAQKRCSLNPRRADLWP